MNDTTMQALGMLNDVNLCDSCHEEQPTCGPNFVIYGTGKGSDNIAACDIYNPVHVRHYDEERSNTIPK